MAEVAAGDVFGPYRVIAPLGKGGMGEVYTALDDRLKRRVALKLLPEIAAHDPSQKTRFIAEARAASALQHPNIVTIFDIGHDRGRDYFAMELVDGLSLRSLMAKGSLPLERALSIAADVAAAIAAAHMAGIVHRDIKPENMIITPSGQAKVLDYGLAKLVQPHVAFSADESTMARAPSLEGTITGTVAYMSPEQAAGEPVDHRTDIFSLGTVMYEMLTGRHPFAGKSAVEQLYKIVNSDPTPVGEVNRSIPSSVADIVEKAIARDRDCRYASAADLRLDLLRALRAPRARAVASAVKRPWAAATIALLAIVSVAMAVALWRQLATAEPPGDVRLVALTADGGYAGEPTFAPDGTTLAYVSDRSGNFEIYLKQIAGGPDINLTNDSADNVQPAFSPDGREIAFVSSRAGPAALAYLNARAPLIGGDIWVMPAFGGVPRRVVERGNDPSWSQDGKSLLYTSGPWSRPKIYRVPALGGKAVEIPIRWASKHTFVYKPSQSSSGRWLAFGTQDEGIYVAPAGGGEAKLVGRGWDPAWRSRASAIVFSDRDRNDSLSEVAIDPKTGAAGQRRPITIGRGRDAQPALSRDGRLIAFAAQQRRFNVERIRFDAEAGKVEGVPEVLTGGPAQKTFFDVSPDQKSLVYQARTGEQVHLWRADAGKEPVQLTREDQTDSFPAWSPDGTQIAFVRLESEGSRTGGEIWTMHSDGSSPQVAVRGADSFINWTPDGRGISYHSIADAQIHIFDLRTRTSRRITSDLHMRVGHRFTSDGRWLIHQTIGLDGSSDIAAGQASGGPSRTVISTPGEELHPFASPSGRWVYALKDHKNLIRVPGPAQGWLKAAPEQVTFFPESNLMIEDPHIPANGKWLYFSRRTTSSEVWLLSRNE